MNTSNEFKIIEMLRQYKYVKASIVYLNETIEDVIDAGLGISYSNTTISKTNKINSTVEIAVINIDKADLMNKLKSMNNTINSIDAALAALTVIERTIIVNRCIEKLHYYEFIHKIFMCERTAKRIRKQALKKMEIIIFGKM